MKRIRVKSADKELIAEIWDTFTGKGVEIEVERA